jgi:multicomponent Na+:H+ antiporter subunit G
MIEYIVVVILVTGSIFILLAATGVARMPDIFARMHSTTKAATLGTSLMIVAVTVYFGELGTIIRSLAVVLFLFLTAPITAHMIGSAAYFTGVALSKDTIIDELKQK